MFFKAKDDKTLSRDDVLKEMLNKANKDFDKKSYLEELMKRENLASTGLENLVAIPHPLSPVTDANFLGVYISPSGINWAGQKINIAILLNLNDNIKRTTLENFYKYLSEFLNDDRKIFNAIKANTLEEFLEIFFSN